MNDSMVKDFQNRIVNASRAELLLINYEMLFATLDQAIEGIDEGNSTLFNKAMTKSSRLLRELSDNLDFQYEISKELMALYIFVNKQFIDATLSMDKEPLISGRRLLDNIYKGWVEAKQQDDKSSKDKSTVIANGQKVYAGLTYGKGNLNEVVYGNEQQRGFKA